MRRREPPAEVWQYVGRTCVLDITFYPEKDGAPLGAVYLESRTLEGRRTTDEACLRQVAHGAKLE